MRILSVFLLIVGLTSPICAATLVPQDIKNTVVFIYRESGSRVAPVANGTGFVVAITAPEKNKGWQYLVTAKHVVHTNPNDFASPLYPRIFVRINKTGSGSELVPIDLVASGPRQNVFCHSDDTVDLAVILVAIDTNLFDVVMLPLDMLVSVEDITENRIGVGTEVFFEGMFTPFLGQQKNYPIARFGRVAMLPDEKVRFSGQDIDAYLVETFAFGGNSGSPVFFYMGSERHPVVKGAPFVKLGGLMKGYFNDVEPIQALPVETTTTTQSIPVSTANVGIAVVVPAQKIRDVLQSPSLAAKRR